MAKRWFKVEWLVALGIVAIVFWWLLGPIFPRRVPSTFQMAVESATRPAAAPELEAMKLTLDTYPAVDGSTSAYPLQVLIAGKALGEPYAFASVKLDIHHEPMRFEPRDIRTHEPRILEILRRVEHTGTHPAYVKLIESKTSLILVARPPSDDEVKLAAEHRVELRQEPIAYDAFVFLVNRANLVRSITLEQAQGIYTGQIGNWRKVGGSGGSIAAYRRNRNSGSQELMEKLVMRGRPMANLPENSFYRVGTMGHLVDVISKDADAIGFSLYYFVQWMWVNDGAKVLGIDGVPATAENIRAGRYPLRTAVYCVTRADLPADTPADRLRRWLQGEEGQGVIAEGGLVPIRGPLPRPWHEAAWR